MKHTSNLSCVEGGCCPVGSVCEREGRCIPAPGVSYSHECGSGSYLCPESLGYGCCGEGMVCGKDRCYSTDASTFVLTRTITTKEGDEDVTSTTTVTTVSTPDAEGTATETPSDDAMLKFYPTAVPKVDPVITDDDDDDDEGGLTKAQIGGAVGGSLAFLAIIVVAAFFVIRRLNHVAKVVEESKTDKTEPEPDPDSRRETPEFVKVRDTEAESISTSAASPRSRFRSGTTDSESEAPTMIGMPSPNTPASSEGESRRQSNRSSTSEGPMTVSSWRNESLRTVGARGSGSDGFVTPISPSSEPAELEAGSVPIELAGDASPIPELPSPVPGTARVSRGAKDGVGHGHKRSVSAATPQLDAVAEDGEFHGYYGPLDKVAGQTSAGPSEGNAT